MGNDYDKLKKQMLAKAKQNRVNKVVSTNKYFKTKTSKSQKDFIAGDFSSSASKKAYGYKKYGLPEQSHITGGRSASNYKKLQNGEDPYKGVYINDGKKHTVKNTDGSTFTSRKRFLTDDEKKAVETTGSTNVSDYKKNYKYAILRGVDSDGKNFDSQFNLRNKDGSMKWDGMNVAKNKVAKGGSKLNYLGGFLKDTVVDSGIDFLKKFDRYESGAMGGALGLAENTQDIVDSITSGDFSFKNVDTGRIKKNWNESIEESNKTGFGHSAGHYLKGMSQRNDDQMYDYLLKTKGKESADAYRNTEQKVQKTEDIVDTGLGIGLDFANPVQLGSAFVKTLGKAGKLTVKSGKAMLNGTGDITTGFKVDPLKTQAMIEKYASRFAKSSKVKKGNSAVETLTEQGPLSKTNKHGSMLNQEYERAMNKAEQVKEVVKSNPNTQNLGHFLDEIGEGVDSGVQRSIDGRTLNKKYTQVKGDYVPQTLRGEEVPVIKENNLDGQLNMLDDIDRVSQPTTVKNADEELYFKTIARFSDNVDSIIKDVDDMPVDKADRFYDWVEKNDPDLFYKLNDTVVPDIEREINKLNLSNLHKPSEINKSYLSNPEKKSKLDIFNDSIKKNEELTKNYEEINKARLLAEETGKSAPIPPRKSYNELKDSFVNYGKQVQEQFSNGDYTFVNKLQNTMKDINLKKLSNDDNYKMEIIEKLNKELFGEGMIKSNIDKGNLTSFVEHLDDVLNYNLTKQSGAYSFKPKGTYRGTKKGTHHMFDRNNNPNEINLNTSFFSPSLLDMNYKDKLSFADNLVGIKSKSELTEPIKALEKTMKKHGFELLSPKEKALYKSMKKEYGNATQALEQKAIKLGFDKLSPVEQREYKSLLNRLDIRDKAYSEVSNMDDAEFLAHKTKFGKGNDVGNYDLEDKFEKGFGGNRNTFNDVAPDIKGDSLEVAINKVAKEKNLDNEGLKNANEFKKNIKESERLNKYYQELGEFANKIGVVPPKKTQVKVKLSKTQKLGSLPPVKENLNNLKTLIKKEVEEMYTNPELYKTNQRLYTSLKKEYINGLRSYGVPDNAYFEKATNLKKSLIDDLKKQADSKVESLLDRYTPTGGKSKDIPKMNLQLLAKKVDEMFDELGSKSVDELSETINKTSWSPFEKLSESLKGNDRNINSALNKYDDLSTETILERISNSDVDPESRNMLTLYAQLEKRGVDFSEALAKNTSNFKKTPSTLEMYAEHYEKLDPSFVNPLKNTNKVDYSIPKELTKFTDDFDPFNSIKGGVDDISDVTPGVKKVRKKKTQAEIDKIDKKLDRYNNPSNAETPLEKIGDTRRLPKVSELMEQGILKEDAFKIIEKMKNGEIDLPSYETIKKADRRGGFNTYTEVNSSELEKILSKVNNTSPSSVVKKSSKPKKKPTNDVKYGQHNVNKKVPKGYILNESTGELEKLTDHLLSNKAKPDATIYDVVEKTTTPLDNVKPKTFKPGEGKRKIVNKNKHSFEKEGKNIEVPKNYTVNEKTGEVEDLSKHLLGRGIKPDSDVYKALDGIEGHVTKSQLDEIIDEIGNNKEVLPAFEKFKKFFTEKSTDTKVGYEDGGLYKAYKAWLNSWKKGLTVYNPGWHAQNFFQNKGQNYLGLGMDALGSQKKARNVLNYINGVDKGELNLVTKSGKTYTKRELANLAKKYDVAEGMATNTTKSNGVFPWLEGKIDNSSVMKKALQSEQTARLHHFITQLERGMSPENASKSVNKYLFDYAHKTKADKMMSDFVDPFWSFHKSNAKLLTTAPFKHPSEVNNILRANRGLDDDVKDDEKVPNSFREHQLPFGSFKDEDNGDNYNYFYDENMMPDVSKALPLESEDFDNKLNPLIRIALQQSKGQGNFGNKIVDKDEAGYDEVTKSERGGEIVRELNPVMNPLIKAYNDTKKHQKKTDEGKQTQSTTDIQKWMEWIAYITGNKGAYYRDTR